LGLLRTGNPDGTYPPSWRWRIVRRGKPMGVRIEGGGFTTYEAARLAGSRALEEFLDQLERERQRPATKQRSVRPSRSREQSPSGNDDFDIVKKELSREFGSTLQRPYQAFLELAAQRLVDHFWVEIVALAKALLKHGKLTGRQIRAVINEARGKRRVSRRPHPLTRYRTLTWPQKTRVIDAFEFLFMNNPDYRPSWYVRSPPHGAGHRHASQADALNPGRRLLYRGQHRHRPGHRRVGRWRSD
jgi:hypothetical protein